MKPTAIRAATLAAILACLAGSALLADWIVTREGGRFEIKGGWEIKGKQVVFTLPGGTLSSLRADQVDLAASKAATEQARQAAAAPPAAAAPAKPRKKSLVVLTDKDFKKPAASDSTSPPARANPANAAKDAKAAGGKDADSQKKDEPPNAVEIVSWDRVPAKESKVDGVELTGKLRNASKDYLTEVLVVVSLFDDSGSPLGRFSAVVANQVLQPSEATTFTVAATGVFSFATVKFDTQGKGFKARPQEVPPGPPPG
ncbi:MAG TPA: FxLYD domain-containing protein [Thermoanaerobaculia bacterium]|nr:FxLYD domain-containing protein [Thermoanaerobaculia bacterium]